MKKFIMLLLLSCCILLFGCSNGNDKDKLIDYLNNNSCYAYLFGNAIDDDYGMDRFYRISSLDSVEPYDGIACIIVDVPKYTSFIDSEFINDLYDLLEKDKKVIVMFYNAENYDFFKGTKLANEKDYYNNVSLILSYNNFYGYIKESNDSSNVISIKTCLNVFSRKVKEYFGSL